MRTGLVIFVRLLLALCLCFAFAVTAESTAQAASCSGLKDSAVDAGLRVEGNKYVTIPKGYDWTQALGLYQKLVDYDVTLLPLHCRALARQLGSKVTKLVSDNANFVRFRIVGEAYDAIAQSTLRVDGQDVKTASDESERGYPLARGSHELSIEVPSASRDEKIVLNVSLDGQPLAGPGDVRRFTFNLNGAAPGTRQHEILIQVSTVKRCLFTLLVNNETERDEKHKAVLVLHGHSSRPLSSGAVRVAGGRHALEVELEEDTAVNVSIDGRELLPTGTEKTSRESLRYLIPLECPKGQDQGRASLVVKLPEPVLEPAPLKPAEEVKPSKFPPMPALFWTGAAALGTGLAVSTVSYFGFQAPAQDDGDRLFAQLCDSRTDCADLDAQNRINGAFDRADAASVWTVGGLVLGGLGAAAMVGAWVFEEEPVPEGGDTAMHILPLVAPGSYGVTTMGKF